MNQVGRELGVRYVLEGSVRKAGNRVRITGQLIDAETGAHLWADRFDGSMDDVFDLQDKVALSVAGVIEPALVAAETDRVGRRRLSDPAAYDVYLRSLKIVLTSSRHIQEALALLEEAIAREPNYGPALALAAICCQRLRVDGRSDDPDQHRIKGIEYARRALRTDGDDPSVLANAAQALAALGENIDAMVSLSERAVSLNPSFARGWYTAGMLRNWSGEPQIALEYFDRAKRLAPRGGIGMLLALRGLSLFLLKRFDEAIHDASLAIEEEPEYPVAYRALAASYVHSGRLAEARAVMKRLLAIAPGSVQPSAIAGTWRNREHLEMYMTGIQLALSEADVQ